MTQDDNEKRKKKHRLLGMHRDGKLTLKLYESQGKESWRLIRDTPKGPVKLASGNQRELKSLAKVFEQASLSREPSRERPDRSPPRPVGNPAAKSPVRSAWSAVKNALGSAWSAVTAPIRPLIRAATGQGPSAEAKQAWHAVIRLNELTPTGVKGGVITSFDSPKKAQEFSQLSLRLSVYPHPLAEKPTKGMKVEISEREMKKLEKKHEGQDLRRGIEYLRWKADQGKYFNIGTWNERSENPRMGQLVRFSSGLDYRGIPDERLVTPLSIRELGRSAKPQLVVFEMSSPLTGVGRVVSLPRSMSEAKAVMKEKDADRRFREEVLQEKAWQTMEMGGGLRAMADREMTSPGIQPSTVAEKLSSLATRGREKGQLDAARVELSKHVRGEYRADIIEQAGEDGKPRISVVISREYRDAEGKHRTAGAVFGFDELMAFHRDRQRAPERQRGIEPTIAREQTQQSQAPLPQEQVKHSPPTKLEFPSRQLEPPANGVKDNEYWIAGVWYGAESLKQNQKKLAYFTQGKERIEDRMMIPAGLDAQIVEPTGRPQYVIGKVVAKGVAEIIGSTRDLAYVTREMNSREQREQGLQQRREKFAERMNEIRNEAKEPWLPHKPKPEAKQVEKEKEVEVKLPPLPKPTPDRSPTKPDMLGKPGRPRELEMPI